MTGRQPTAFLLHGYLGSGKTTLARRLEVEESALRFTHDEWMRALYGNDPPADQFVDYASRVSALMESLWMRCLSLGTNIILDSGFWSRRERDRVRERIASVGARAVLYHLSCPDEVAWARIESRNSSADEELHIAANTFEVLKARFEPLQPDEDCILIETGPDVPAGQVIPPG